MTEHNRTDLVQGTLHMLILKTLALEPMHGYGRGLPLSRAAPARARRAHQGGMACDGEQPSREVLRAHGGGARDAPARDARLGAADRGDRAHPARDPW